MKGSSYAVECPSRSQIRILEEEAESIRRYILEHESDRVGDLFTAHVGTWPQRRLDARGLVKELGKEIIERFTTDVKVPTIQLKAREPAKE